MSVEPSVKSCPICGSNIPRIAIRCRSCGHELIGIRRENPESQAELRVLSCPKCNSTRLQNTLCLNCGNILEHSYMRRLKELNQNSFGQNQSKGDRFFESLSKSKKPVIFAVISVSLVAIISGFIGQSISTDSNTVQNPTILSVCGRDYEVNDSLTQLNKSAISYIDGYCRGLEYRNWLIQSGFYSYVTEMNMDLNCRRGAAVKKYVSNADELQSFYSGCRDAVANNPLP